MNHLKAHLLGRLLLNPLYHILETNPCSTKKKTVKQQHLRGNQAEQCLLLHRAEEELGTRVWLGREDLWWGEISDIIRSNGLHFPSSRSPSGRSSPLAYKSATSITFPHPFYIKEAAWLPKLTNPNSRCKT